MKKMKILESRQIVFPYINKGLKGCIILLKGVLCFQRLRISESSRGRSEGTFEENNTFVRRHRHRHRHVTLHLGKLGLNINQKSLTRKTRPFISSKNPFFTTDVDFTNMFTRSFYAGRSLKGKNSVKLSVSFCAFGIFADKSFA